MLCPELTLTFKCALSQCTVPRVSGKTAYLECRSGEEHVCGLHHVGGMDDVVVRYVSVVVVLQGHHEREEGLRGNLEGFQQVPLL